MTSTNDTPERNDLYRADDRIDLLLVDDSVLLYEPGNPAAWLESDEWVPLVERR